MPTNEFPELDNKLDNAIDLLLDEKSKSSGAPEKNAADVSEEIMVPFPEAITRAGAATPGLQPDPWGQEQLPLVKTIAESSPEGLEVANHLKLIEEKLLKLEWEVSEENARAIIEELLAIQTLSSPASKVPQVVELMNRVLSSLCENPHALTPRQLQFLFEAKQTLVAVCAQALNCPLTTPPQLDLLEEQYVLLSSPPVNLTAGQEHAETKVGFLNKPLVHWEHLGENSISVQQYRNIQENLVKNVTYLAGIFHNLKKREKGLGNLISDLFLWYLGQSKKFWLSYRAPQSLLARLAFWKKSTLATNNTEAHQAQVRLGNYLEDIEDVNHEINQSLDTISKKLNELENWIQELQQLILVDVYLFKMSNRIFAIPAKDNIKTNKSAALDLGGQDSAGSTDRYIKIDIRTLLSLETENMDSASEVLIVQDQTNNFAILAEEIYGKEIVLFTRLDKAAGGPCLAGIALMEGIPCYLLELEQLMQSAI